MDDQQERRYLELGWLIGILDGEGSYMINFAQRVDRKNGIQYRPIVAVGNTNQRIIERLQAALTSLEIPHYVYFKKSYKPQDKVSWLVKIEGLKRVKRFMDILLPHLDCRREQAETLNAFVTLRLERGSGQRINEDEVALITRLRELNSVGNKQYAGLKTQPIYPRLQRHLTKGRDLESSETTCQALVTSEDIVRPTAKSVETSRNV